VIKQPKTQAFERANQFHVGANPGLDIIGLMAVLRLTVFFAANHASRVFSGLRSDQRQTARPIVTVDDRDIRIHSPE
jgi:hypothetical protein